MKLKIVYTLFILAGTAFLFLNNSSGAASVQGVDRTGSPLSPGPCQTCHSAGAFSAGIEVDMLDNGSPTTTYEAGKTYTLRVRATNSGSPAGYGFQAVALNSDDDQVGSFGTPPSGFKITTLAGRDYVEQSSRRDENTLEIEWEAPAAGSGDVNVYASVVVANGMQGSGGDGSAFLNTPVTLSEVLSSTNDADGLLESMTIFPNPVGDVLQLALNSKENADYQLLISNMNGQVVYNQRIGLTAGEQLNTIDVSQLTPGVYSLQITDGQMRSTRALVKR
jgi:hypothetical protein